MAHQLAIAFLLIGIGSAILSLLLTAWLDPKQCSAFTHGFIEFIGYVGVIFLTVGLIAFVFTSHFPNLAR